MCIGEKLCLLGTLNVQFERHIGQVRLNLLCERTAYCKLKITVIGMLSQASNSPLDIVALHPRFELRPKSPETTGAGRR
jgi:hypothetical protein